MNWLKARAGELSTWAGVVLGAAITAAQMFSPFKPELAYIGFGASVMLVLLKEQPRG